MDKILFVNACVRENSRTLELAKSVLKNLSGDICEVKLDNENLKPLNRESLTKRDKLINEKNYSDEMFKYARQFAESDIIVIAAPYWDLAFPALLKIYLEQITVTGITFEYIDDVPRGLCKAKQLIYVTTAGGPMFVNYGFDYVKTIANNFFGIENVYQFKAENLDIMGADVEEILNNTKKEITDYYNN